jgi:Asp-tRNA(Asn)/Glu-tRNA(Gln) amidotransferase C subunit
MPELTFEEVAVLAKASGVELSGEELEEVTHRYNNLVAGVEAISYPGLDSVDPMTFRPLEETDNE